MAAHPKPTAVRLHRGIGELRQPPVVDYAKREVSSVMSWEPKNAIATELLDGESALWVGTPSFWPMLRSKVFRILFGGVFAGIALAGMYTSSKGAIPSQQSPNGFVAIIPGLFACVGSYISISAVAEACAVGRMAYAVTNQRILVVNHFLKRRVLALAPSAINAVELHEQADGSGSVTFRRETVQTDDGPSTTTMAFVGVQDVRSAALEIERLRTKGR